MRNDYDDIINLPHYEPKHHPRMSMWNRAAQFAPFAALTGYDAAIRESGRLTDDWVGLSESGNEEMNSKMELIVSMLPEHPSVTIEYFVPDRHKAGGSYQSYTGNVKRIDEYEKLILIHQVRIDSLTLKYPRLISVIMIFLFFSFLLSDISSGTWLFRGNSCPMFYNDFGAWSNNVSW